MPASDDFASELRGGEDEPLNAKGNDWVASIVGGLVVGVLVAGADRFFSRDQDDSKTLVELQADVRYLARDLKTLTEQPYVRVEAFRDRIQAVESRLSGLDSRVDQLERRAGRHGGRRED